MPAYYCRSEVNKDLYLRMNKDKPAKIIVIEGTDRSGKETQSKKLQERLTLCGFKTYRMSFPNYDNESSIFLKKYLNGDYGDVNSLNSYQSSMLFALDRFITYKEKLDEIIKLYDFVILDRYVGSNIIHQSAKLDRNSMDQSKYIDYWTDFEFNKLGLPKPDITILLNMPIEIGKKISKNRKNKITNSNKQDIHESNDEYMYRAYSSAIQVSFMLGWETIACYKKGFFGREIPRSIADINDEIFNLIFNKFNLGGNDE